VAQNQVQRNCFLAERSRGRCRPGQARYHGTGIPRKAGKQWPICGCSRITESKCVFRRRGRLIGSCTRWSGYGDGGGVDQGAVAVEAVGEGSGDVLMWRAEMNGAGFVEASVVLVVEV
jgi:hypothetical protein